MGDTHLSSSVPAGFPDLSRPRYDQSSYYGRVRHFMDVTDVRTLLASTAELERAKQLIEDYKRGVVHSDVGLDEYWRAQKLYIATFHSDTNEKVFLPFRMSAFLPVNVVIIAAMLVPNPSNFSIIFWQWVNQSVNVAVNYANANKTSPMPMEETVIAYGAAVTTSVSVALGLNRLAQAGRLPKYLVPMIPFAAVALAGTANVFLMRQKELRDGITVMDDVGNDLGKSQVAGFKAVSQVAISRVATAFPCILVPSVIMARVRQWSYSKANPKFLPPLNLGIISLTLMTALPCAIGMFPQRARVPVSFLEPQFQNLRSKDGSAITHAVYNKGL